MSAVPLPSMMPLRERMYLESGPSSDPRIVKLEADAAAFAGRFATMLRPTKKEGEDR